MFKRAASIALYAAAELIVFWLILGKLYTPDIKIAVICVFLVAVVIRAKLSALLLSITLQTRLVGDTEKDKKGEVIDRKPYQDAAANYAESQVKHAMLGLAYLVALYVQ